MGGLTNSVLRALERMGLAGVFGASRVRCWCLRGLRVVRRKFANSAPASAAFWWSRKAIPITSSMRSMSNYAAPISRPKYSAKACCRSSKYASSVLIEGLASCLSEQPKGLDADSVAETARGLIAHKPKAAVRARRPAAATADFLHRLPGTPGVFRHQTDAARTRANPYQRRHRLPFIRNLRAVLASAIPSSATACRSPAPRRWHPIWTGRSDRHHGRRRLLAQRLALRRRVEPAERRRRRPDRDAERLRLRHRPSNTSPSSSIT